MACTIDHLQADHRVRVLREFRDARGTRHQIGDTAILRRMELDWARQEIVFDWERDGTITKLFFALAAKDGPRNGHMKEYFALEERIPLPEDLPAARRKRNRPPIPQVDETPVDDAAQYAAAVARVSALAARQRFAEAKAQVRLILAWPDPYGGVLQQLAEDLVAIAEALAAYDDAAGFAWARDEAINLWYAWGSQATSGGEGAVRADSIRAAEEKLERCGRENNL